MKRIAALVLCALLLSGCSADKPSENSVGPSEASQSSTASSGSGETEKSLVRKKITKESSGEVVMTVEYEYDADGNALSEVTYDGAGAITSTVKYEYSDGNLVKETYYDASDSITETVEYVYENGRITNANRSRGNSGVYTYNEKDRLARIDYGANQIYYTYTSDGVLAQKVLAVGNDIYAVTTYTYYEDGTLASESEDSSNGIYTINYKYRGDKLLDTVDLCDGTGAVLQYIEYVY